MNLRRVAASLVAFQLLALGLYPAPLVLWNDPATQGNPAVRLFFEHLLFWAIGIVIIIAPVIAVATPSIALRDSFHTSSRRTARHARRLL